MPRRRALTKAQLESLLALPVTEADLVRHWTLSCSATIGTGKSVNQDWKERQSGLERAVAAKDD
jgi:hypothetical protein